MAYYICDDCRERISPKQSESTDYQRVYSLALTCSECSKRFYTAFKMTNCEDKECDQYSKTENFIGCQFDRNAMACQDHCYTKDNCVVTESELLHVSKNNSSAVESQIIPSHASGECSGTSTIHPEVTDEKLGCFVCKNACGCSINSLCNTAGGAGEFPFENFENDATKKTDEEFKLYISFPSTSKSANDEMCNDTFDNESTIENPIMKQSDFSSNECNICQVTFKTKQNLKDHMKKHDNKNAFTCKVCKKICLSRSKLASHMIMHSEKRPHKCNFCALTFKSKSELHIHLVKHSNLRSFKCHICPSTFKLKHKLNRHMITHSDKRPHKCNICTLTFKLKHHLQEHSVRHSNVRPFKCDICPLSFKLKSRLTRHMFKHPDKLPQ